MRNSSKYLLRSSLGLLLAASAVDAESPNSSISFEAAAIRPSAPVDAAALRTGRAHIGIKIDGARVDVGTASLLQLVCIAYRLKPWQVSAPDWLKATNFDVQAAIPANGKAEEVPEMLQALLAGRFGLRMHRDNKEKPVYALVVAKGGPKLVASVPDPTVEAPPAGSEGKAEKISVPTAEGEVKMSRTPQGVTLEMPAGEIKAKVRVSSRTGTPPGFHIESDHITMKTFAELLSVGVLDRPVVDTTNLPGYYDVTIDMSALDAMRIARNSTTFLTGRADGDARSAQTQDAPELEGASIHSSIQNMGLRLEPRKMPILTLIVDHVEKVPTAN